MRGETGPIELALERVKTLGHGRGARVDLVRDRRTNRLIAEKLFGHGRGLSAFLTTLLYWLAYQAPFAYHTTANAVWAAYYRRKAVRLLTEYWFGVPCIADALYIRWDAAAGAFVLGTEYIAGRPPRVSRTDPYLLHRWLRMQSLPPQPVQETDALVGFMDCLRFHLGESGFVGAQWQVDRRTLVATANFLHNGDRWIALDLESGVPALTIPRYLREGLRLGRFPLFDDTDFARLQSYIDAHACALTSRLGPEKARHLRQVISELENYECLWKRGEIALWREPRRWFRADGRKHIRRQTIDRWLLEGHIGPESVPFLEASSLRFLRQWLFGGMIRHARHWARFVCDVQYRATSAAPSVAKWIAAGRIHPDSGRRLLANPRVLVLGVLAIWGGLPLPLVRFLRDPPYRARTLRCAWRALVDEAYQLALAERSIGHRIHEWECAERLTPEESEALRQMVGSPSAQEYVRGFGVHLTIKALLPSPLLDPLSVGAAVAAGTLYPLVVLFIRSSVITVYTLTRWLKRRDLRFGTAFAIGLVPKLSILAYPVQLLTVHPELACFLVRDLAARLAERLPIYGGRHTLTEHYCIRGADVLLAFVQTINRFVRGRFPTFN
ncbi:MAG TPA: hypothetical protein VLK82_02405 [Candidatus Tectomicrobia bacterium]|nr:hypothetical protein [Candidatus Tectomicrobia bacterium]